MSKYREDEAYFAYLAQQDKNKTQTQDNNNDGNNKNDILDTSKLDNMMAKIEIIESLLKDIHIHLGIEPLR
jgi:hypothetical protein